MVRIDRTEIGNHPIHSGLVRVGGEFLHVGSTELRVPVEHIDVHTHRWEAHHGWNDIVRSRIVGHSGLVATDRPSNGLTIIGILV